MPNREKRQFIDIQRGLICLLEPADVGVHSDKTVDILIFSVCCVRPCSKQRKTLALFAKGSELMHSFALRLPLPTRICALTHILIEASLDDL